MGRAGLNIQNCLSEGPLVLEKKDFRYDFPEELIAQHPTSKRDSSRLLVRKKSGEILTSRFANILDFLPASSLIITNDTRVFASRLFGNLSTGGKVEVFFLTYPKSYEKGSIVECLVKPFRKFVLDGKITFPNGVIGRVAAILNQMVTPLIQMQFDLSPDELARWCQSEGSIPLPPYIRRIGKAPAEDQERYQTVYAQDPKSVAAPTAGLHFTPDLLAQLATKNIRHLAISLHVGGGTFLPVKTDDLNQHFMHTEDYLIPSPVWNEIIACKKDGRKVIAVGTTSFRALESLAQLAHGSLPQALNFCDVAQSTNLFIKPQTPSDRYRPLVSDFLITNFHQPESTLFMLICSLIGFHEAHQTYRKAIEDKFRLFSYGDSNLLEL